MIGGTMVGMETIKYKIESCKLCDLYKNRTNVVVGEGRENADIMFVGEAPGKHEDETGRPFVGRAGEILNLLMESIGLDRKNVYITSVVKCRPPSNRNPTREEVGTCMDYLNQQIQQIKPRIIVALGKIAASNLLGRSVSLKKEHGSLLDYSDTYKIFITYHPAAYLYGAKPRARLHEDFRKLRKLINTLS